MGQKEKFARRWKVALAGKEMALGLTPVTPESRHGGLLMDGSPKFVEAVFQRTDRRKPEMRKIAKVSILAALTAVVVTALSIGFTHQAHAEPPDPCFHFAMCGE